jgi:hypothetical protein
MNVSYVGSLAERKMKFSSFVSAEFTRNENIFNAISIYIPASHALENIVDYNPAWTTVDKPAVMTCDVSNYKKVMQGRLLDQWMPVFRQDTNTAVVLYLIIFADGPGTDNLWRIDDVSISFAPLSRAFLHLFHISYIKVLFDPSYDGRSHITDNIPGTPASANITLTNPGFDDVTIPAGNYQFSDGVRTWIIPISSSLLLSAGGGDFTMSIQATTIGNNAALTVGELNTTSISPNWNFGVSIMVNSVTQGTNSQTSVEIPSRYFDLSLALAHLVKMDMKLSLLWALVKIALPLRDPDENHCWIRSKNSRGMQLEGLGGSIRTGDRNKYFYGALCHMECANTHISVHSEPVNTFVEILSEWFALRNPSGQFVGNKLAKLRLTGFRVKPLGIPSWLNTAENENDSETFDAFDDMFVGYLATISGRFGQNCYYSSARTVTGLSVNALMISKWVDHASAQDCAELITDKGTLVDPVLADETAYTRIQEVFKANLGLMAKTKRVTNTNMMFPAFRIAKTGLTELEAASAWQANYTDDLDSVVISGGLAEN